MSRGQHRHPEGGWWYALIVPPQKEFAAKKILTRREYTPLVPEGRAWRRKSRYRKAREEKPYPLVRGYVFIHCTTEPFWHDLFNLSIIRDVVRIEGRPHRISDHEMQELQRLSGRYVPFKTIPNPTQSFVVGDQATVSAGSFVGHESKVIEVAKDKAKMTINILGKRHDVWFAMDVLAAA